MRKMICFSGCCSAAICSQASAQVKVENLLTENRTQPNGYGYPNTTV